MVEDGNDIFPKENDFHSRFVFLFRNEPRKDFSFGSPQNRRKPYLTTREWRLDDAEVTRSLITNVSQASSETKVSPLGGTKKLKWATGKKHENPSLGFIGLFHSKKWNTSLFEGSFYINRPV